MATFGSERLITGLDPEQASLQAARIILGDLRSTLTRRERFRLVVTGGRSPVRLYQILSEQDAPWDRVDWFWSDERAVPPDHPDSNYALVATHLLSRCDHDPSRVFRMPGEERPLERAAEHHEETLLRVVPDGVFDFVLLGMGEDGHVASLFPGHPTLLETERAVIAVHDSPKPPSDRLSLTLPWLARGRRILVLTSGTERERIVRSVLADPAGGRGTWPVAMLPLERTQFIIAS